MEVKIKKLSKEAVIPSYATEGDACFDLTAVSVYHAPEYVEYKTGLAMEIPEGYFGKIWPRSSVSKTSLLFATSGVIDSGYRGEITVRFKKHDGPGGWYNKGERIAQMIILPYPQINFIESDELSSSVRGANGHGSTGLNNESTK